MTNKDQGHISSGATLVNLILSDDPNKGLAKGAYHFFVGDSSSGKTLWALTILAEASLQEDVSDYRFIYDDVEGGNKFDIEKMFGKKLAQRIEPPSYGEDGEPLYSRTVEEFYYFVHDALEEETPFIYILDSMDGLSSESEMGKFLERKEAYEKGKEVAGTYGDGKAKQNASGIRQLLSGLRDSGSILIVLNQTRDNIGSFTFEKKTRSGGHALRFYATVEIWTSVKSRIKKTINGKPRQVGQNVLVKVKKNRETGLHEDITIPIIHKYGIDDTLSCISFLLEEKVWTKAGRKVKASHFDLQLPEEELAKQIEEQGKVGELRELVAATWKELQEEKQEKILHGRKSRYE